MNFSKKLFILLPLTFIAFQAIHAKKIKMQTTTVTNRSKFPAKVEWLKNGKVETWTEIGGNGGVALMDHESNTVKITGRRPIQLKQTQVIEKTFTEPYEKIDIIAFQKSLEIIPS